MKNETWTQLLLDMSFFDDTEDHIMDLRRRFVFGAAGKHSSRQNDKLLFGYSDSEWEYIWTTMLEDGAWAVPSIKDVDGNTLKENYAPEMLIKYIAHELKCNIIVFDLVLDNIQFVSGNHLKSENVAFVSPLLIYSTGSHFQSVFQEDHDFFVNYANELEMSNVGVLEISDDQEINFCSMPVRNAANPESAENSVTRKNTEAMQETVVKKNTEDVLKTEPRQKSDAAQKIKKGEPNREYLENKEEHVRKIRVGHDTEAVPIVRKKQNETTQKRKGEDIWKEHIKGSSKGNKKIKDMTEDEKRSYQREQYRKRKEFIQDKDHVGGKKIKDMTDDERRNYQREQ